MQIFNRKRDTERHLSQLSFVLCCFISVDCYIMPSFNHVQMLTERVDTINSASEVEATLSSQESTNQPIQRQVEQPAKL